MCAPGPAPFPPQRPFPAPTPVPPSPDPGADPAPPAGRRRRREARLAARPAALLGALALALGLAAPASALTWPAADQLSTTAISSRERPALALDANGNALAVWVADYSSNTAASYAVRASYRPAGGPWGPVETVPGAHGSQDDVNRTVDVGFAPDGTAILVYRSDPGALEGSTRAAGAGGGWAGAPSAIDPGAVTGLDLVVDGSGNALVAFGTGGGVRVARRPAGGAWALPAVGTAGGTLEASGSGTPSAAVDGAGDVLVAYRAGSPARSHSRAMSAAGAWGPVVDHGTGNMGYPSAAVAPDGSAVVAFTDQLQPTPGTFDYTVYADVRGAAGTWASAGGGLAAWNTGATAAMNAVAAARDGGAATVLWAAGSSLATFTSIMSAERSAGAWGAPATLRTVSAASDRVDSRPQIASDAAGNQIAAWSYEDTVNDADGTGSHLELRTRAGGGAWGPVQPFATAPQSADPVLAPGVAVSQGVYAAAWVNFTSTTSGQVLGAVAVDGAPQVTIATPALGLPHYARGAAVNADYSCTDDVAVTSCTGPVASGAALDTATAGTKTFTVVARDGAGHQTSVTHSYVVDPPPASGGGGSTGGTSPPPAAPAKADPQPSSSTTTAPADPAPAPAAPAPAPAAPAMTPAQRAAAQTAFEDTIHTVQGAFAAIGGFFSAIGKAMTAPRPTIAVPVTVSKPKTKVTGGLLGQVGSDGLLKASLSGGLRAPGGGSFVVAAGGGNVVAAGGGNVVAAGGGNVVAAGGGNVVAAGGGNVVAAGGGNVVAAGGGNVVAAGGLNRYIARAAAVRPRSKPRQVTLAVGRRTFNRAGKGTVKVVFTKRGKRLVAAYRRKARSLRARGRKPAPLVLVFTISMRSPVQGVAPVLAVRRVTIR